MVLCPNLLLYAVGALGFGLIIKNVKLLWEMWDSTVTKMANLQFNLIFEAGFWDQDARGTKAKKYYFYVWVSAAGQCVLWTLPLSHLSATSTPGDLLQTVVHR